MNFHNLARKAKLGKTLKSKTEMAITRLRIGSNYYQKTNRINDFEPKEREFRDSNYLFGIYSILDFYLTDMITELLVCFPEKLEYKELKFGNLLEAPSLNDEIIRRADEKARELSYGKLKNLIKYFQNFVKFEDIEQSAIDVINEIKCTRDIYAHNSGIVNALYLQRAGQFIRVSKTGSVLPLGDIYLNESTEHIISLIDKINTGIVLEFVEYNRVAVFKNMWVYSHMSKILSFEEAWRLIDFDDMVQPTAYAEERARYMSTSEKILYDFFLSVYNGNSINLSALLDWWPANTKEGKIILSWMNSPFSF